MSGLLTQQTESRLTSDGRQKPDQYGKKPYDRQTAQDELTFKRCEHRLAANELFKATQRGTPLCKVRAEMSKETSHECCKNEWEYCG